MMIKPISILQRGIIDLTGVASQFSARRQLGAVHGSSSVRLAMHQHTRVYVPKNI